LKELIAQLDTVASEASKEEVGSLLLNKPLREAVLLLEKFRKSEIERWWIRLKGTL
jgi:hypothetical protein